jgi:quercetin dioxygenase-like cupin family protein
MAEQKSQTNGSSNDPLKKVSEEHVIEEVFLRYLQGELGLEEMEAFEYAAARDPEQAETIRAYSKLLDTLRNLLPEVDLSNEGRIRSRIMSIPNRKPVSKVVRADEGEWIDSGMIGFEFKLLFVDPDTKKSTVLARIAAGARMPHHRHQGAEECLIIEGSLWTDGVLLQTGDFIVTEDQTEHEDTWSPNGALALLKTYLSDEILTA